MMENMLLVKNKRVLFRELFCGVLVNVNILDIMIFKNNKYTKWYFQIIEKSTKRPTPISYEKHHIVPRCIGGSNELNNLCQLTLREHYLVHLLLTKMCIKNNHEKKLKYAADMMISRTFQRKTSRLYESIRIVRITEQSKRMKKNNSHLRLHSIENTQKARVTKISRRYTAWNNNVHNPNGASNGKQGAIKQRKLAIGRKRYYEQDDWTWIYPRSDGSWFKREKLTTYCKKYKEVDITPPL